MHTPDERALLIECQATFPRWACEITPTQPDGNGLIDEEPATVTMTPPPSSRLRTPGLYLTVERYGDREPRIKYHVTARTQARGLVDRGVGATLDAASSDLFRATVNLSHAAADILDVMAVAFWGED